MHDEKSDGHGQTVEKALAVSRRQVLGKMAIGVGALAGISILPEVWTRPIIGHIVLPAHAATSGASLHDP